MLGKMLVSGGIALLISHIEHTQAYIGRLGSHHTAEGDRSYVARLVWY